MQEVEAKLRLGPGEADLLRSRLLQLGALRGSLEVQVDTYFAHPQRDFGTTDEALRLRHVGDAMELTYKGPREAGTGVKARKEETVHVRDDPTELLRALGFGPAATVRKHREEWQLGSTTVCIDDVEGLGQFVEVEVVAQDIVAAAALVEEALVRLGLGTAERESRAYLELLEDRP